MADQTKTTDHSAELEQGVGLDDFNPLATLGRGHHGHVVLAETTKSKKLHAIRILKKEIILENNETGNVRSERQVFLRANREKHPFLTDLDACFQTDACVYFVMEYISGGNLLFHLQKDHIEAEHVEFYAAEICLGLRFFHENGILYRNLKLNNILLAQDGHIKLADYCFCKEDMWHESRTKTFCGTAEFMAPEILLDKPYGHAIDWWAFGIVLYELLVRQEPFRGDDADEIYDAILTDDLMYPSDLPRDAVLILQNLLTREPEKRLGSGPTGAQEVMSQYFFDGINWNDIYQKKAPVPFLPTIKHAKDVGNFDAEFTNIPPVLSVVASALPPASQKEFLDFSWQADQ